MKTATVGEIQKNFAKVLKDINSGEEITVTKRGKAVAKITAIGQKMGIDWPDFNDEAIELKGQFVSDVIIKD
ncbi:MAG: type II toxin-antitoxin system prevent-host-death family antitoxin, partial [Proteobacteria bacterium]|nr:type II toxin-antitoxin system prevent-host-death family antitoxin [Pseudomonadota bacterium]